MAIGLVVMAAFYLLAGVMHFVKPDFYRPMMPPFIPQPRLMIVLSGIAEIILGGALFLPATRSLAAWGVIALLVAVWPANIYMALSPEKFPKLPRTGLWVRVILQIPLMYWAFAYT